MHNWHGAVLHGVQLIESAGLEATGHEQDVSASCQAVGHADAEAHPASALLVPLALHLSAQHVCWSQNALTSTHGFWTVQTLIFSLVVPPCMQALARWPAGRSTYA